MKRLFRFFFVLFVIIISLLILALVLIQIPAVQSKIANKVIERVNDQFGTQVNVGNVKINYLGDVNLYNVTAKDHRNNEFINIAELSADLDLLDLYRNSSHIDVKSAKLTRANVNVITYLGERESNFIQFINKFVVKDSDSGGEFVLDGDLTIANSKLKIINHNLVQHSKVWLDASQFNAKLNDVNIEGNIYSANIDHLRFDAIKNGEKYRLKDLTTKFKMTEKGLFFQDLNLETQSSHLNGFINLTYNDIGQFSQFGDSVVWDIQLKDDNKFGYKDLRYFVPNWVGNEIFDLKGEAKGPLNFLSLKKFSVSNQNTFLNADEIQFQNLTKKGLAISSKSLNTRTSYQELKRILPGAYSSGVTDFIQRFGQFSYKGDLNFNESNISANGFANTDLGNGKINVDLVNYSGKNPKYFGTVNTDRFDLGKLTSTNGLGNVSGKIEFNGGGYDLDLLSIKANGKINYIEFNGERYNNIDVDGEIVDKSFKGFLSINDGGKLKANYTGIFDFSKPNLKLDFNSNINYANLNYFGVSDVNNTWISGDIKGITELSNINNLIGDFEIKNLTFNSDTIRLDLPLSNISFYEDELHQKNIDVNIPNYVSGKLIGKFNVDELGILFENGIGNFMVEYEYKDTSSGQYLNYLINFEKDLLKYFVPETQLEPSSLLVGTLNNDNKIFEVDFTSPKVSYQNNSAEKIHVFASTSINKSFSVTAENVNVQGLDFYNFNFEGQSKSDTLIANAHFYSGENFNGDYDLNFYQTFNEDKHIKIGFSPSTIKVDEQVWNINQFNDSESNYAVIDLDNKNYNIVELLLNSEEQFLKINADYENKDNFSLEADINDVKIQKAIPDYYIGDIGLKGTINGKLDITKLDNNIKPITNLTIDSIYLKNQFVGRFVTNVEYNIEDNEFVINGSLDKNQINTLFVTGAINNKGVKPQVDLVANLDEFNVDLMDAFLSDVLAEWKGQVSGEVSIKGDLDNPSFIGNIDTENLGFRVVYLGTYYTLVGTNEFMFNKQPNENGLIDLADVKVVESVSKTSAIVDGALIFSSISDWFLDLDFTSDKIMVMNTTVADNELFYGKIFASGDFYMFGPAVDLEVSTSTDTKVLAGSVININTGGTKTIGENKFIQFYSYNQNGDLVEAEENSLQVQGFSMDLTMDVDDGTVVNLVLDAKSDDQIQAQGFAEDFKITMNKAGNLSIDGNYIINTGIYTYREGIIIDKDFEIEEGGSIRFTGDPYNAQLDLKAVYNRNVNNMGTYLGINYMQPTMIDLIIDISGDLNNTQIDLDLDTPNESTQIQNLLKNKLQNNPDEKIKQVGSVLVLGRLDTSETIGANTATDAAAASAFELLGKQVGGAFSNIIPGLEINPTYLQSTDNRNQADRIQTQFNLAINERLSINGAVGTPLGTQYNEEITTQLEIDYDISKQADGGLRLRAFSRPSTIGLENYNINTSYTQSYGAGIVYRKSFNNIRDLFKAKNSDEQKKEEKDSLQPHAKNAKDSSFKKEYSFIEFK